MLPRTNEVAIPQIEDHEHRLTAYDFADADVLGAMKMRDTLSKVAAWKALAFPNGRLGTCDGLEIAQVKVADELARNGLTVGRAARITPLVAPFVAFHLLRRPEAVEIQARGWIHKIGPDDAARLIVAMRWPDCRVDTSACLFVRADDTIVRGESLDANRLCLSATTLIRETHLAVPVAAMADEIATAFAAALYNLEQRHENGRSDPSPAIEP